jgi:hypothetical protein
MPSVFSDGVLAVTVSANPSYIAGPGLTSREALRRGPVPGEVELALADSTWNPFLGFADSSVAPGASVVVQTSGPMDGFVGLIPGSTYYLDQTTPGAITDILPASGEIQVVGWAETGTTLFVAPSIPHTATLRAKRDTIFTGIHITSSGVFQTVATWVGDFTTIGTLITFRFFIQTNPGTITVRIQDITGAATLGSLTVVGSATGLQSFPVTHPGTGARQIELQDRKDAGGGSLEIRGGTMESAT